MLLFTLSASLIVAFLTNPIFAVDFMNHPEADDANNKSRVFRNPLFWIFLILGIVLDLSHFTFGGNILILFSILMLLNSYLFTGMIHTFQNRSLPWIMSHYERGLRWVLKGWRPVWLLIATFFLMIFSFVFLVLRKVPVVFFPKGDPNFIFVYLQLPVGTNVDYTDSVTHQLENRVYKVLDMENGKSNPLVESVISTVAIGANNPQSGDRSTRPELGRVQVSFVEFEKRHGRA